MHHHNRSIHPVRALALPRLATGLLAAMALLFAGCADPSSSPTNSSNSSSGPALAKVVSSKDKGGDKDKGKDHDKGKDKDKGGDKDKDKGKDRDHDHNNQCEDNGNEGCVPAGTASNFTLLANAAVTATDATIIGDVGTFLAPPTGSVTLTTSPVTGTVHIGDATAIQAFDAFLSTYAALAPEPGDVCTSLTGTLAGVTLAPGSYCFDAAAALTGVLTLDGPANGVWIFKVGTSGTGALTGTNFSVVMANGGQACNVTWWVAEATTMTTSNFQGNILAGAAITMTGGGTFDGNAWSKADITLTGVAATGCEGSSMGCGNDGDNGDDHGKGGCNQGVGNGPEDCDPGNSNHRHSSNDENGGTPGNPGRKGGGH